jgi:hypothetical protein
MEISEADWRQSSVYRHEKAFVSRTGCLCRRFPKERMMRTKKRIAASICFALGLLMAIASLAVAQEVTVKITSVSLDSGCPPKISVRINAGSRGSVRYRIEYRTTGASGFTTGAEGTLGVNAGEQEYKLDLAWIAKGSFSGEVRVIIIGANTETSSVIKAEVNCSVPQAESDDPPDDDPNPTERALARTLNVALVLLSVAISIALIGGLILFFSLARLLKQDLRRDSGQDRK